MAATGLQLNWVNVAYASTPITRVTQVTFDLGGQAIDFSGDNDRYSTVIARNVSHPSCSITSGDVATLMNLGGFGTITATQLDALNATGGAINWTLVNAVFISTSDSGSWGQFASATANWRCFSPDGQTSPLSFRQS